MNFTLTYGIAHIYESVEYNIVFIDSTQKFNESGIPLTLNKIKSYLLIK